MVLNSTDNSLAGLSYLGRVHENSSHYFITLGDLTLCVSIYVRLVGTRIVSYDQQLLALRYFLLVTLGYRFAIPDTKPGNESGLRGN